MKPRATAASKTKDKLPSRQGIQVLSDKKERGIESPGVGCPACLSR